MEQQKNEKTEKELLEKKNYTKSGIIGVLVLLLFISILINIFYAIELEDQKNKVTINVGGKTESEDESPEGLENLIYRDITNSDVTFSEEYTLTSAKIIIQANTDIENFYAKVSILDSNRNVLETKTVSYSDMSSGSKYEVVFNLSLNLLKTTYYRVSDMSGKVRR